MHLSPIYMGGDLFDRSDKWFCFAKKVPNKLATTKNVYQIVILFILQFKRNELNIKASVGLSVIWEEVI